MRASLLMTEHVVYRCYAADGELLYIGCTHDLARRMVLHRGGSPWMARVDRIKSETHPNRGQALRAEAEAILAEQPTFNVDHKSVPKAATQRRHPIAGKKGRPSGHLINPDAVNHLLGDTPQVSLAERARVAPTVLSEMIAGRRGASPAIAERISAALGCKPGVIFPELVGFTVAVRYFTANGAPE